MEKEVKNIWLKILWNEKVRRWGVAHDTKKVKEARLRWYGHVRRQDEAGKRK